MKSKIIEIPNIGIVLLERSERAKHINISIKPPSKIRVAVPISVSFKKAGKLVLSKTDWINKHLVRISDIADKRKVLSPLDRNEAREVLEKRINMLSKKYSFSFNKLNIRNQKTRWGSCSSSNNINLNAKLLHLSEDLIDYVILHELVHTKIKNHSKDFWNMLDKHIANSRFYHKRLKQYRLDG